jgi:predicted CXXCH cytochrome family protein
MKKYGIPTDQLQKYETSVHAEALFKRHDLSAPTCNDCHGNHGAAPPGTASVGNVCGTCHARQSELFAKSPHKTAFDAMNLSECAACHSNHDVGHPTDALIGTASPAVCITCHDKGEAGYQAADLVHRRLAELTERIAGADDILKRAARAGMEVSKASFELNDARDSLTNARVVLHSFAPDEVEKVIVPGVAISQKAHQAGENALRELLFRRQGLAVSLIVIAVAAASIYFKIRQIERDT